MTKQRIHSSRFSFKSVSIAGVAFLVGCIGLLWSWNTLAVDLFEFPEAGFKHAVAAGLLILIAGMFRSFVSGNGTHRLGHGEHHHEDSS